MCLATLAAQAPKVNPDASAYASLVANEVSQLHEGITLAKWMEMRGKREGWEFRKAEVDPLHDHPECLSQVKTEALPSGAKITRVLYFYPPPMPSTLVFPTATSPALLKTCTVALVRAEAAASTGQIQVLDQALRQRLTKLYGESIGEKDTAFWGRGGYGTAGRWVRDAEIVSSYDDRAAYDYGHAPGQLMSGPVAYVRARLPIVKNLEFGFYNPDRSRPTERQQFHRAAAMAGVDAALSNRAGLAVDKTSDNAKDAWRQAWHLSAGLLPSERYVCFGD
jgi:hypothetical protein